MHCRLPTTRQSCWTVLSVRKAVLPHILANLRDGGKGAAAVAYRSLSALLATVPDTVYGEGATFCTVILQVLRQGVDCHRYSGSDSAALVDCFMETCAQFIAAPPLTV